MKLPHVKLTQQQQLDEFDIWITPSLGEIRDTDRFKEELARICAVFEALAAATNGFQDIGDCRPTSIANTYARIANASSDPGRLFFDLASTLFLVTGKSDNNAKCQLPLFLRDRAKLTSFPRVARGGITEGPIPRVLKSDLFMATVAGLISRTNAQIRLLEAFVGFVLSDDGYIGQLWSIGRSFVAMKSLNRERDLLSPLVVFQVRGSVSASGGHIPEDTLRSYMEDWGLVAGCDFNSTDAAATSTREASEDGVTGNLIGNGRQKTRAYDFILPYRVPSWRPRLLIQSQFYAGDAGSVSHKNVDQTSKSRQSALEIMPQARFLEYVDGAGYFSSLNGDLKNLLAMPTTRSFVQIRSAPIRLRRELQNIGFLTPLDVAHAVLQSNGDLALATRSLQSQKYSEEEIRRSVEQAVTVGIIARDSNNADIPLSWRARVRRYFLLDVAACHGASLDPSAGNLKGKFLIPGYGPFFGLPLDELAKMAFSAAPRLKKDWSSPDIILGDIRWLCETGFAMAG